jgi:hypothetical protein
MLSQRLSIISQYDLSDKHSSGLKKLIDDLCAQPESEANLKLVKQCLAGEYSAINSYFSDSKTVLATALTRAGYVDLSRNASSGRYEHDRIPLKNEYSEKSEVTPVSADLPSVNSTMLLFTPNKEKVQKKESLLKGIFSFKK